VVLVKNKINLILFYIRQNVEKIPAPPQNLSLEIIRGCNFHCQHCFSRLYSDRIAQAYPFQCMPTDRVHSLLKDARSIGCRTVTFCGLGEPTAHPDFFLFLSWAKDLGYSVEFTSNGWTLEPEKLGMLDSRDSVRISIDTMHLQGSPRSQDYLKKMADLFSSHQKNFKMIAVAHGDCTPEIQTMFLENNMPVIYYPLMKNARSAALQKKRTSLIPCLYPWYSLAVHLDFTAGPCPCATWVSVGELNELTTLRDIWYGAGMNNFRNKLRSGNFPDVCATCDRVNRKTSAWIQALCRKH